MKLRGFFALWIVLGLAPVSVAPAASTPKQADSGARLSALLDRFREIEGLSAQYREEKHMDLLVQPLVSSGTLYYARSRRLARHQEEPTKARVVIIDNVIWFDDGISRERMDLAKRPAVRMFVDSVLLVLAGEEDRLDRLYKVEFRGDPKGWSLDLRPRVHPMDKIIESIRITGHDVVIEQMIVRETGGDVTKTEFHSVDPRHRFTPSERKRVFRLDPTQSRSAP